MGLFSRRSKNADETVGTPEAAEAAGVTGETADGPDRDLARGPHDVADVPDVDGRLDLGALRVRLVEGAQVGFAMDQQRTAVHGVTLRTPDSSLFVELFAAPRTLGVWDDVRAEILAAITAQGGTADEITGWFGRELLARQVVQRPDGTTERLPTRLVGIDGPRWFIRATFSGRAATAVGPDQDEAARHPLELALTDCVVVRDQQPRAPRSRIALTMPGNVRLAAPGAAGAPAPAQATPAPEPPEQRELPDADEVLRRGPEITEIR